MIRIGIVGYGNLGKSAEQLLHDTSDMELVGIFSRRSLDNLSVPCYALSDLPQFKDRIDVLLLCLGSATDIPQYGPKLIQDFHTVDVYDNHRKLPAYRKALDELAKTHEKTAIVAVGWDPGLFSLQRALSEAILPETKACTFWGKGVSQGHSDAIRRIPGVEHGVQYTLPNPEALEASKNGKGDTFPEKSRHIRHCYVVCDDGECHRIHDTITTMPDYFDGYNTIVDFISEEEFLESHQAMPHGGQVLASCEHQGHSQLMRYELTLGSNPNFTAMVMIAYARAAYRLAKSKDYGAKTVFDVPIALLSQKSYEDLIETYL